jgi:hypothetical protein
MSNEKGANERLQKISDIDAGKAVSWRDAEGRPLREGVKPSAPANFTLPEPVASPRPVILPTAPVPSNTPESDNK